MVKGNIRVPHLDGPASCDNVRVCKQAGQVPLVKERVEVASAVAGIEQSFSHQGVEVSPLGARPVRRTTNDHFGERTEAPFSTY